MPYLDQVLDEVLRLYPPAWIGPAGRSGVWFNGHTVPEGRLPQLLLLGKPPHPRVLPGAGGVSARSASTRERKAALPRGAYVPFGGGKRICIGKCFGQIEVKLVATMLLQRMRLDLLPGCTMTVRQTPTLSPKGGLKMRVPRHHGD